MALPRGVSFLLGWWLVTSLSLADELNDFEIRAAPSPFLAEFIFSREIKVERIFILSPNPGEFLWYSSNTPRAKVAQWVGPFQGGGFEHLGAGFATRFQCGWSGGETGDLSLFQVKLEGVDRVGWSRRAGWKFLLNNNEKIISPGGRILWNQICREAGGIASAVPGVIDPAMKNWETGVVRGFPPAGFLPPLFNNQIFFFGLRKGWYGIEAPMADPLSLAQGSLEALVGCLLLSEKGGAMERTILERIFQFQEGESGRFAGSLRLTALSLYALARRGFSEDPKFQKGCEFLLSRQTLEGAFRGEGVNPEAEEGLWPMMVWGALGEE